MTEAIKDHITNVEQLVRIRTIYSGTGTREDPYRLTPSTAKAVIELCEVTRLIVAKLEDLEHQLSQIHKILSDPQNL